LEPSAEPLELLWEAIKQHKIQELKQKDPNLEIDQDDQDFLDQFKQLTLTELKKDLKLYPELPIPKGCTLVHPAKKDPGRWVGLSSKVKADLYGRFLKYLENWKAGKHAASVYGYGGLGPGDSMPHPKIPKCLYDDDPEWAATLAALDAELAKSIAASLDEDGVCS
jgi:hypothetical protein